MSPITDELGPESGGAATTPGVVAPAGARHPADVGKMEQQPVAAGWQTPGPAPSNGRVQPDRNRRLARLHAPLLFRLYRFVDLFVVLVVLGVTFVVTNLDSMPKGMDNFLAVRLTVRNLLVVGAFLVLWRLVFKAFGLYQRTLASSWLSEVLRTAGACAVAGVAALSFPLLSFTGAFGYWTAAYFWIVTTLAVLTMRLLLRVLTISGTTEVRDLIVVGSGPRAARLHAELCGKDGREYNLLGFVDSNPEAATPEMQHMMLGTLDDLEGILMRRAVDEVLIALPIKSHYHAVQEALRICHRGGVPAGYLADVFEFSRARSGALAGTHGPAAVGVPDEDARLFLKRAFDILGGSLALVLSVPVLAVAALAVRLSGPGPILFTQERYGLNKRLFRMYKLRTMVPGAEATQDLLDERNESSGPTFKIRDDPRITRLGRILRRTSIDELPQLVNVLKGEMSLVGPRPLPVRDVHRFTEAALMRRFSVKPGITCLWQIGGRNELTFDDWIALDLQYIDRWSLGLDLLILFRTIPAVLTGRGAS